MQRCRRCPTSRTRWKDDSELDDRGPGVAAFDPRIKPPDCVLAVTQRGSEGEGAEGPLFGVQASVTVAPADPNAPGRVMGVVQVVDMATPRGQTRQEFAASCSDTDSVASMPRRRRLVLVSWADLDVPDSHEERVARVRHRMQNEHRTCAQQRLVRDFEEFFTSVVRRVVPTDVDAGEIPRALRRQRWSVLNVPLMWAAAAGDDQSAVLQWLMAKSEHLPPLMFDDVVCRSRQNQLGSASERHAKLEHHPPESVCPSGFTNRDSHFPGGRHISAVGYRNAF